MRKITTPFTDETIKSLKTGDSVLLSGTIYTGRDSAHKRMMSEIPFEVEGQAIYYSGPCPAPPGRVIGSVGPTTSSRMDAYSPQLIERGLKVMIGKGERDRKVIDAIRTHTGLYLAAIGGAAALMSLCVEKSEVIAFDDLGTEAVHKLTVRDMPLVVAVDCKGNNLYKRNGVKMSCYAEKSLKKHYEWQGKIEVVSRVELNTQEELSVAYTPGVAEPCVAIQKDVNLSYELTRRGNTVAIVTDGSAVLGLGNIGAEAAMPVMEGKAVLFKEFGGVDAIPICIRSGDIDEIVNTVRLIAGSFGGINLEDISAPRCFEIERRLKECCDIPIFHDDQHGTAIVVLAALRNALKLVGKKAAEAKIVINGAGAAGTAVSLLLKESGMNNIAMCDKNGEINTGASLFATMKGADVFIGLSAPDCVTREMVAGMNKGSIVFAMANPVPEIMPDEAKAGGAFIVGTGRSDFPNQINNVLAFPGLFRGVLDVRARDITTEMKIAAAEAIAGMVSDDELCPDYIIPSPLNRLAAKAVAKAVAEKAASQ